MKTAVIQLRATEDKKFNIYNAVSLVKSACRNKSKFILLPEVFNYRGNFDKNVAESLCGESLRPFAVLAREQRVHILTGSICERVKDSKKVYNTSVLFDPRGEIIAKYRKVNLFKAVVGQKKINESRYFVAGKRKVCTFLGRFSVGLSICYDLRFPGLYQKYLQAGVDVMCVPSAFTYKTGADHWEVLLRARAIENLSYVLAPNQYGEDSRGIRNYGNSMIIDPWGKILARASKNQEEIIYAHLDKKLIQTKRKLLPNIN